MIYRLHKSQRGVALITAMLVFALAAIAATAMMSRNYVNQRRTENVLFHDQGYLYLLGAEDWARNILIRDRKTAGVDSLKDDWATKLDKIPLEGGDISGRIDDLQGLFNINNLDGTKPASVNAKRFTQLLVNAGAAPDILSAVIDWIDADDALTFPGGAEDTEYLYGDNPYRAANRKMLSPTELLLVKGITPEIYAKLAPNVIALRDTTDINVNTAPAGVLQCIVEGLSNDDAKKLIEARDKDPYHNITDFLNAPEVKGKPVDTAGLTVMSSYYLVSARVQLDRTHAQLQSIIYRPDPKSPKSMRVLLRSQGGV